ncbi:hypothetical protein COEREDRAFT_6278 [Coemansia reversa NRRL 1564]|uniref:Uncharacterized protein n=1 Tax=Coemansia reversa (strain ATCC 12441 / NRRL 1564) TaxID=763665 RepID=A0A2G5BHV7_COERN|nr:hypothetical protein COEREDRAFT_6278 [Coemansia reversa NRRL 1564]|eukprot:PIA18562.1 hypothetical protein COEREDRAFT_6278 [Coemansia reversa NRRL 1564]
MLNPTAEMVFLGSDPKQTDRENDFISIELGTSEDDFKNAGYAVSLPEPSPSASSAPPPIVSHENANLFWHKFVIFAAIVVFYCLVTLLVRKISCYRTIDDSHQLPVVKDNDKTNKHLQAAVALLKEQLALQQNQMELLRRELSATIDRNDALTRENCKLVALIENTSRQQPQGSVESLTCIYEINSSDESNNDSDSDAELYHDGSINRISVINGGNMLGKVTLVNNSDLSIASSSRSLARLKHKISNSRIKRKASKIFDLSAHGGRKHK